MHANQSERVYSKFKLRPSIQRCIVIDLFDKGTHFVWEMELPTTSSQQNETRIDMFEVDPYWKPIQAWNLIQMYAIYLCCRYIGFFIDLLAWFL